MKLMRTTTNGLWRKVCQGGGGVSLRRLAVAAAALCGLQAFGAGDSISVNIIGGNQGLPGASIAEGSVGVHSVSAEGWNNLAAKTDKTSVNLTGLSVNEVLSDKTIRLSPALVSLRAQCCYAAAGNTTSSNEGKLLYGYLDDGETESGKGAKISVSAIPYSEYTLYVYCGSDGSTQFGLITVNGTTYPANATGSKWGSHASAHETSGSLTLTENQNYVKIEGLTASELVIQGAKSGDPAGTRTGLAAIQIVNTGTRAGHLCTVTDGTATWNTADGTAPTITAETILEYTGAGEVAALPDYATAKVISLGEGVTMTGVDRANAENIRGLGILKFTDDLSGGLELNIASGISNFEFEKAKITNDPGASKTLHVKEGDTLKLAKTGQGDGRTGVSLNVSGGEVTLTGSSESYGTMWYGNDSTFVQTGGRVTCTATGSGTSGSGNGLLLGWSGQRTTRMTVSGGELLVERSSINFWHGCAPFQVTGSGRVKAKGVFVGNGSGHSVVLSESGVFELGSIGWRGATLNLNGGTLKAYENTTVFAPVALDADSALETPGNIELTLAGATTGSGALTKKGAGTLHLGVNRPKLNPTEGVVEFAVTPAELKSGVVAIPVSESVTAVDRARLALVNGLNNEALAIAEGAEAVAIADNTLSIKIANAPSVVIDETCSISAKIPSDTTGVVLIVGPAGAGDSAITVTFDSALPAGVTLHVYGKVDFALGGDVAALPVAAMTFKSGSTVGLVPGSYAIPAGVTATLATGDYALSNQGTVRVPSGVVATLEANGEQTLNGTVDVAAGAELVLKGAVAGTPRVTGTGKVVLEGGALSLGLNAGTQTAQFVARSGDSSLTIGQGESERACCANDSKDAPFIKVEKGATLRLAFKDFSGWAGATRGAGWIVNEGSLDLRVTGNHTRYFRDHLVLRGNVTIGITTLEGAQYTLPVIVYGGNSTAQIIAEETAALDGKGPIQFNVNGSGGTQGAGIDVADGKTLTVANKITGGEAVSKSGAGTLVLTSAASTYNGSVTLKAGVIKSVRALTVQSGVEGEAVCALTETVGGVAYNVYRLGKTIAPGQETAEAFDSQSAAESQLSAYTAVSGVAGQSEVIKLVAKQRTDGKWVITVGIDEEKMPGGKKIDDTLYAFGAEGLDALAGATEATPVTLAAGKVTPGLYYSILYASDLKAATWSETTRVLATVGAPVELSVPAAAADVSVRFFKVAASLTAQ